MTESAEEQSLISNKFGSISSHKVIFLSNKSLLTSGLREEIPLKQISSVRFYQQKSWIALIAGSLGLVLPFVLNALLSGSFIGHLSGLVAFIGGLGIAYLGLSGIPTVVITKTGGTVTQAKGWPPDKSEAKAFALVLREKIVA